MSEYLDQIMSMLQADATLVGSVDAMVAESPHEELDLSGTTKTVLCLYDSIDTEDKWMCLYRDVKKSKIVIKIEIVSSNGNNDSYCSLITDYVYNMMSDLTTFQDIGWVLHINNYKSDVIPEKPARWKGTITLDAFLFENT